MKVGTWYVVKLWDGHRNKWQLVKIVATEPMAHTVAAYYESLGYQTMVTEHGEPNSPTIKTRKGESTQ